MVLATQEIELSESCKGKQMSSKEESKQESMAVYMLDVESWKSYKGWNL